LPLPGNLPPTASPGTWAAAWPGTGSSAASCERLSPCCSGSI
jgi:hypothetical protein